MATSAGGFWIITAVTAVPAAVISIILERRRAKKYPSTLPFAWGTYFGLNAAFVGIVGVALGLLALLDGSAGVGFFLVLIGAIYIASGFFAVRRSRAGLIASTMLSFNILWWIINAFYIRNRWNELRYIEHKPDNAQKRKESPTPGTHSSQPATSAFKSRSPQYAIDCPICGNAPTSDVRTVWFLWGMILLARYGHRTFVGCEPCVRRESLKSLVISGVGGWWCFPWGLGTPLVIIQNLWESCRPISTRKVEDALRKVGMNPDDLRLDSMGFTRVQRRLIDITAYVLNSAIWADGTADPREHARALSILQQISSGRLSPEQAAARLASVSQWDGKLNQLSFEIRQTLLTIALDVAAADGVISLPEMAMLHQLAQRLGFSQRTVEEMLNGTFEESSTGQTRTRGSSVDDIAKAATILGVRVESSLIEVQSAWRQAILRYHPDRAGGNSDMQRDFTLRSQEINWAKDVLMSHASRMAAA
jgi:DnaJ-domain-containing protein 1